MLCHGGTLSGWALLVGRLCLGHLIRGDSRQTSTSFLPIPHHRQSSWVSLPALTEEHAHLEVNDDDLRFGKAKQLKGGVGRGGREEKVFLVKIQM